MSFFPIAVMPSKPRSRHHPASLFVLLSLCSSKWFHKKRRKKWFVNRVGWTGKSCMSWHIILKKMEAKKSWTASLCVLIWCNFRLISGTNLVKVFRPHHMLEQRRRMLRILRRWVGKVAQDRSGSGSFLASLTRWRALN